MDEVSSGAAVEVLEVDALGSGRGRRFWFRVALVALAVVILLVASEATRRWLQATAPTFSRDEVAQVYAAPLTRSRAAVDWDPSTLLLQDGGLDVATPSTVPALCAGLLNTDEPPVSVDLVSANLAPVVRPDGGQVFSGTIVTYRYAVPADARAKQTALHDDLGQCASFGGAGTRFTVDQVAGVDHGRARSDLSFRLDDGETPIRVTLIRFGNTLTWITTPATVDAVSHGQASNLLVARMQSLYRAR